MSRYPPKGFRLAEAAIMEHGAQQKIDELELLCHRLDSLEPHRVLEIGSQFCGTTWLWTQLAANDATIVAVDLAFQHRVRPRDARQQLHLIEGNSHHESTYFSVRNAFGDVGWPISSSPDIDLLFLDGDHSYEGVKADYLTYGKLVKPGGLIVFHDIAEHTDPTCEVKRFWDEVKKPPLEEFICQNARDLPSGAVLPVFSCGIGVMTA